MKKKSRHYFEPPWIKVRQFYDKIIYIFIFINRFCKVWHKKWYQKFNHCEFRNQCLKILHLLELEGGNGESNGRGNKNTSRIRDLIQECTLSITWTILKKTKVHRLDVGKGPHMKLVYPVLFCFVFLVVCFSFVLFFSFVWIHKLRIDHSESECICMYIFD